MMEQISLYFHVPYCRKKCIYCDFFCGGLRIADWQALKTSFIRELSKRRGEWEGKEVVSIYFGGGTPSLMPADYFLSLTSKIYKEIRNFAILSKDREVTLEVNPEDVNQVNIQCWKIAGVNRISLGIQTFKDSSLKQIGRRHTGEEAVKAFSQLRNVFSNISADLIFGLPGQSLSDLREDMQKLVAMRPSHISVYSLMFEAGTALTALRDAGRITGVDDEVSGEMYREIKEVLTKNGYRHYETSNYSLPGFESRHNTGYWTGRPYVGIGPSAHSYDGNRSRKANPADLKAYLNDSYNIIEDNLSEEELIEERIMLSLRMEEGIDLRKFSKDFGGEATSKLLKKAQQSIKEGNLRLTSNFLSITDKGLMISDTLIVELF